ncbi:MULTISPECIES: hypothetical protein [Bradyrhizobium]|uniref:Uncharacterized protein n=1 Tax=Bradyrhizobium elkanii TaxID=29448 RepID=A0A4U6RJ18_BRAEL|nr:MULTISPECIES: hypothetical protein [Bradyrhizobium]MTV11986.1 hypothetical protein [Bradyrhizobium sp. BR2003]TKV74121.1 hypothetical protein FDV58_33430 [Bradyrhizobium elkanii]
MAQTGGFDFERSDIATNAIAWIAAGLGTFVLVIPVVMPLIFPQSLRYASPAARPALSSSAPPLEVAPSDELERARRDDVEITGTYGWVDRNRGIVRVPVKRATEMLLRKGLPEWPAP